MLALSESIRQKSNDLVNYLGEIKSTIVEGTGGSVMVKVELKVIKIPILFIVI